MCLVAFKSVRFLPFRYSWNCNLLCKLRVCVITLSPEHHILKQNKKVVNINYQVSSDTNRLENKVSGKWKKVLLIISFAFHFIPLITYQGGQKVEPTSILCKVKCSDGSDYDLLSCVNGTIVEVNQKLLRNCDLLTSQVRSPKKATHKLHL